MSQSDDYFSDLLQADEAVQAILGGPGPGLARRTGTEEVWFQLAWTSRRLLVVRLAARGGGYVPADRYALARSAVQVARFPRTPQSAARVEITGGGRTIQVVNIDDPTIFPYVEPFLVAWGGPVIGAGEVYEREVDPYELDATADTRKLLMVAGAGLLLIAICCGCSGLIGVLRGVILPMLTG